MELKNLIITLVVAALSNCYIESTKIISSSSFLSNEANRDEFIRLNDSENYKKNCNINLFYDEDEDGFGGNYYGCTTFLKYVSIYRGNMSLDNSDCNDFNSSIYPGAPELTNDSDDDCDSFIDEGIKISSDSSTVGNNTFTYTDGIYINNFSCKKFYTKINIFASDYERSYVMNNISSSYVQILDGESDEELEKVIFNSNTSHTISENSSEDKLELKIQPSDFCKYISSSATRKKYVRLRYSILSQEGMNRESFFVRNSYLNSIDGSMPDDVSYYEKVDDGVQFLLYPSFFSDLSESITESIKEKFKELEIQTGSSKDLLSTNYDDVSFKILADSELKRYKAEFSSSGIYFESDCFKWIYFNKPKIKVDFQLRVPEKNESLAEATWANFAKHTVNFFALNDGDDCDPDVVESSSEFSDISSDTNKNYVSHESQFALNLYSIYFTLNDKQPTSYDQLDGTSNIFNNLAELGTKSGIFDYPAEQILASISLGLYKNNLLKYVFAKNDIEYNGRNTAASMQKKFREAYKSAWPEELISLNTLDPQRFYNDSQQASSSNSAKGDIVGAIEYFMNSILTFKIPAINWSMNIRELSWGIKLVASEIFEKGSFLTFSTQVGGGLSNGKQNHLPFFQEKTNIPYNEVNFGLDMNSAISLNSDVGQQFISSSVAVGQWNVEDIIQFDSEPIIEKVQNNIIYVKTKNFIFGGNYLWKNKPVGQFFRVDAEARLIVNQLSIENIKNYVYNYLNESVDSDWIIGFETEAEIKADDITYINPVYAGFEVFDYNSLKLLGQEGVYFLLHYLACTNYRDSSEEKESIDGWDFLIPIDDENIWSSKNVGKELTKENYCSNLMNGYVKKYMVYIRIKNVSFPQILNPFVIENVEEKHQIDLGINLNFPNLGLMMESDTSTTDNSDPNNGCTGEGNEKCSTEN